MTSGLGCVLTDIAGTELTPEDKEILRHPVCAGIILFARNYQNRKQLRALCAAIRQINSHALITVDQEGGRVQRFRDEFTLLPAMSHWGKLYDSSPQNCLRQLTQSVHILTSELRDAGVFISLMPVLDLNHGVSAIIGERSLHSKPEIVSELGRWTIEELHRQRFPAIGKHFPGHGAVSADSHQALPEDIRQWSQLWRQDLQPFVSLIHQLDAIMPAHIIFSAMDYRPVSFSPFWLKEVLRRRLAFRGLIISDDLSMAAAATRGGYADRAIESFQAGCDLLLICNHRQGAQQALESLLTLDRRQAARRISSFFNKYAII
jgi:beta-N-acetylhexosaminidase